LVCEGEHDTNAKLDQLKDVIKRLLFETVETLIKAFDQDI